MRKQKRYAPWFKRPWGFVCPATGYEILGMERSDGSTGYEIVNPGGYFLLGDYMSGIGELPMLKRTAHEDYILEKQNAA